jgi:hypothetical protein
MKLVLAACNLSLVDSVLRLGAIEGDGVLAVKKEGGESVTQEEGEWFREVS